jgi:hypothetical protein
MFEAYILLLLQIRKSQPGQPLPITLASHIELPPGSGFLRNRVPDSTRLILRPSLLQKFFCRCRLALDDCVDRRVDDFAVEELDEPSEAFIDVARKLKRNVDESVVVVSPAF